MLTSTTIVLITFAVLCFTSSTKFLDTTTLPTGVATNGSYGVMLRQRGFRPLLPQMTEAMSSAIAEKSPSRLVERWWNVNASDPKDQIAIIATDAEGKVGSPTNRPRIAVAAGLLGLSPGESKLSTLPMSSAQTNSRGLKTANAPHLSSARAG